MNLLALLSLIGNPKTAVDATDYVTVSSLPHPLSMFMIGILLVLVVFLIILHFKLKGTVEELKQKMDKHESEKTEMVKMIDSKISDISKKVDSRVDKAILAIKKAGELQDKHHKSDHKNS